MGQGGQKFGFNPKTPDASGGNRLGTQQLHGDQPVGNALPAGIDDGRPAFRQAPLDPVGTDPRGIASVFVNEGIGIEGLEPLQIVDGPQERLRKIRLQGIQTLEVKLLTPLAQLLPLVEQIFQTLIDQGGFQRFVRACLHDGPIRKSPGTIRGECRWPVPGSAAAVSVASDAGESVS